MQDQNLDEEEFWTPGLKALVALNIFFLVLILIGLIMVALFISPYLRDQFMELWAMIKQSA